MSASKAAVRARSIESGGVRRRPISHGEVVELAGATAREIFIRYEADPSHGDAIRQASGFYLRLPELLASSQATMADLLLERVYFRDLRADFATLHAVRSQAYQDARVDRASTPLPSYIGQPPCAARQAFQWQLHAVVPIAGVAGAVLPSSSPNDSCVKIVRSGGCRHLYATQITGASECFRAQSDLMFETAAEVLKRYGATFRDVIRTWYYLDDIGENYAEFNRSRNQFFQGAGVQQLPASTGIGARLPMHGTRCSMDLCALLDPACAPTHVMHAATLNEAPEYGSAFSRGIRVCLQDKDVLYVSGTASVDQSGATAHAGNFGRQVERMLINVQQLLTSHEAAFSDIVQATTYLKSAADAPLLRSVLARWGLAGLSNTIVQADVCRPELLCEMEVMAIVPRGRAHPDSPPP